MTLDPTWGPIIVGFGVGFGSHFFKRDEKNRDASLTALAQTMEKFQGQLEKIGEKYQDQLRTLSDKYSDGINTLKLAVERMSLAVEHIGKDGNAKNEALAALLATQTKEMDKMRLHIHDKVDTMLQVHQLKIDIIERNFEPGSNFTELKGQRDT